MGADDVRTVRDLKRHQAIVLPMISEFGGRVIDTAGDGILAEFASVMNLLECAVAIQKIMAEQNAAIEPARRLQFRIGVNIGDVIYDEARIYGDGVNVAARLEGLAPPGGICISEDVYRQSRGKLELITEDIGKQKLKNITQPVRVYRVRPEWVAAIPGTRRMPGKFSGRSLLLKIGGRLGVAAVGAQRFAFALVTVGMAHPDHVLREFRLARHAAGRLRDHKGSEPFSPQASQHLDRRHVRIACGPALMRRHRKD
jgi:hypothetical protein